MDRTPRTVMIAFPSYPRMIHLGTMRSIIADMLVLNNRGDKVSIFYDEGNSVLPDSRALILAKFMASGATDLIMHDYDMTWENGTLPRLVDAEPDFVGVAYPYKRDPIEFIYRQIDPDTPPSIDPVTGLIEVAGIGGGLMRLRRSVVERMIAHYPDSEFELAHAPNERGWALFDSYWVGKKKYSEDFSFCQRWRDMAGRIWIVPNIQMGHIGLKTFSGSWP